MTNALSFDVNWSLIRQNRKTIIVVALNIFPPRDKKKQRSQPLKAVCLLGERLWLVSCFREPANEG